MKIKYILLSGAILAFSSCSTAYRSAQTPDDVYYSAAPVQSGYANSENDYVSPESEQDQNSYAYRNSEESQIRAGIQDPIYRSPISLDLGYGYGYGYNPYGFGSFYNPYYYGGYNPLSYMSLYNPYMSLGLGYGGLYNPYYSLYNPYYNIYNPYYGYGGSYIGSGHSYYPGTLTTNSGPRKFNLNPYTNRSSGAVGTRGNTGVMPYTPSTPIRRTTGVGNVIRRVFAPNRDTYVTPNNNRTNRVRSDNSNNVRNNNDNNYNRPPERTFNNMPQVNNTPSASTPSSSGGGGGSAPVRSFGR